MPCPILPGSEKQQWRQIITKYFGTELLNKRYHPVFDYYEKDFSTAFRIVNDEYVSEGNGTGIVHICPVHGMDDFILGKQHNLELPMTIDEGGIYYEHIPVFAGKHIFKVDPEVCDEIEKCNNLISKGQLIHSYPHSWRSKAPLVYKNTSQWFISMESHKLREKALKACKKFNAVILDKTNKSIVQR